MNRRRIGEKELTKAPYWADAVADYLIRVNPGKKKFVCAAGISPSGSVHFGNFREIATTFAVVSALQDKGKQSELIFSWDNFDRFRKVPAGIPASYEEHIGKALSSVPSPDNPDDSYAEIYEKEFQSAMEKFNIPITYKNQTALYTAGTYDEHIITAMRKRKDIADILLSFMTDKGKELKGISDQKYRDSYYPISVYSRFTHKDATDILSYDGHSTISYRCRITGKEEKIDFTREHIVKLSWKVDWAMRWMYEDVCFEPAGSDHAAPGGSYDTSSKIAKEIFGFEPPVFTEFGFVGLRGLGTKMSGSSGKNITPFTLFAIYEPALLLWMYFRRLPKQTFSLAFDTEVYRQYDEMDQVMHIPEPNFFTRLFRKNTDTTSEKQVVATLKKLYPTIYTNPISFRQLVGLGQIVQWDEEKLCRLLAASGQSVDRRSVSARLPRARVWVTEYNTDALITLRTEPNTTAWVAMDEENKEYTRQLREYVREHGTADIQRTEEFLYSLPKAKHTEEKSLKKAQRELFKCVYQLLIGADTGPRLSTFLWSISAKQLLHLFSFNQARDL